MFDHLGLPAHMNGILPTPLPSMYMHGELDVGGFAGSGALETQACSCRSLPCQITEVSLTQNIQMVGQRGADWMAFSSMRSMNKLAMMVKISRDEPIVALLK